ncbi:UbiA prenyltransferase family-domain-containing protein [Xylariaceae sp. AK1471]|nr:UbiA prenyltransferase family-domain-containing protein [Xylariaceae sp. AK1471]
MICSHIATLFLLTKSDFKTVVVPQATFALAAARSVCGSSQHCLLGPQNPVVRMLSVVAWLWIHLLVENLANQRLPASIIEDMINKPWRPIPAGRLTPAEAQVWLQVAVLLALLFSLCNDSLAPSTTLMTMIWLYNDLDGSSRGPCQRNALNAVCLGCFGWGGASVLLGFGIDKDSLAKWTLLTGLVGATTVHVQDFPDIIGDEARKRKAVPLIYGETLGRWSVAVLPPAWSLACSMFWTTPFFLQMMPLGISILMVTLVVLNRGRALDEMAWKLWCLWVVSLYLLPVL